MRNDENGFEAIAKDLFVHLAADNELKAGSESYVADKKEIAALAIEYAKAYHEARGTPVATMQLGTLEMLGLTVIVENRLKQEGIHAIDDLIRKHRKELLAIPAFGAKCLKDVEEKLAQRGLKLA